MSNSSQEEPERTTEEKHVSLMQQMLEATLMRREDSLSESEWASLRRVAVDANSRGAGTVEFFEALIWELCMLRFPKLSQDAATTRRLCHRISATLAADPYARTRLAEFQQHLLRPA